MICIICNTFGERFQFYIVIIFGLVAVHLCSILTVWNSVLGLILVQLFDVMGNSLLCQAGLGIRTVQTQGENRKVLQAKFDDRGEVAGSWLL